MTYTPIEINRDQLTIMGVPFPDIKLLERTAKGIGNSMFEGFTPTPQDVQIIRDMCSGELSIQEMIDQHKV